jgi:hypothetical protein
LRLLIRQPGCAERKKHWRSRKRPTALSGKPGRTSNRPRHCRGTPRPEEALPHIKKSLELCESIGAKFEVVRGLLAQGEALLACHNPTEAATILTKTLALAVECQLEREESIAQTLLARIDKASP